MLFFIAICQDEHFHWYWYEMAIKEVVTAFCHCKLKVPLNTYSTRFLCRNTPMLSAHNKSQSGAAPEESFPFASCITCSTCSERKWQTENLSPGDKRWNETRCYIEHCWKVSLSHKCASLHYLLNVIYLYLVDFSWCTMFFSYMSTYNIKINMWYKKVKKAFCCLFLKNMHENRLY